MLVMASSPTYDPNLVERHFGADRARRRSANCGRAAPLVNRATDGLYIPGSTFKVVTAAAALDSRRLHAGLDVRRHGLLRSSTARRSRTSPTRAGPEVFGHVELHDRARALDQRRLLRDRQEARAADDPRLREAVRLLLRRRRSRRPSNERSPSGLYDHGRALPAAATRTRSTRAGSRSGRSGSR